MGSSRLSFILVPVLVTFSSMIIDSRVAEARTLPKSALLPSKVDIPTVVPLPLVAPLPNLPVTLPPVPELPAVPKVPIPEVIVNNAKIIP
uniref:Uncharacterized protein n=1 Tax=Glycine max TaxID=3847 RepID=C6T2C0_SOYBN|nr:unknown [Glycine max]